MRGWSRIRDWFSWLVNGGMTAEQAAAVRQRNRIVLGDTVPRTGPDAEEIVHGFIHRRCPVCSGQDFTPEERPSDKILWSCGNPACRAKYMETAVSGYRFVDLCVRSRLRSPQA